MVGFSIPDWQATKLSKLNFEFVSQIKNDAEQTAAAESSQQTVSNSDDLDSIKDLIKNREMPDKEREILMMMHQIAELEQLLSRQSDGLQDSQEEVISLLR